MSDRHFKRSFISCSCAHTLTLFFHGTAEFPMSATADAQADEKTETEPTAEHHSLTMMHMNMLELNNLTANLSPRLHRQGFITGQHVFRAVELQFCLQPLEVTALPLSDNTAACCICFV